MTTPTDRPNLDRLRELDKAATPRPACRCTMQGGSVYVGDCPAHTRPWLVADALFTAAAKRATPALVAALDAVLALHVDREVGPLAGYCVACGYIWPCRTRRALTDHLDLTKGA